MRLPPGITKERYYQALLRKQLNAFTIKCFKTVDPGAKYLHNWHIDLIAEYLEACTRREIKRLIINMPPRYMKSIAVSIAWPAWLLGKNPKEQIMVASYAQSLATKHSIDTRLILNSDWYKELFPNLELVGDQNTKTEFVTTERGHRIATSVGGVATGKGGGILIVDDPHSPAMAASEAERQTSLDWFDQTFTSRLNDKKNGVIVVVMQRLHQKDLTGHLLEKGGYEHLCLQGINETPKTISFGKVTKELKANEPLHVVREGLEELNIRKKELGTYGFSGQYQQQPTPLDGGIIDLKWFKRYNTAPASFSRIIHSWDTAVKAKEHNDPSVCTIWGETEGGYYLLDVFCDRLEYPDLKRKVQALYDKYPATAILIEDKASGQQLIQDFRRDTKLPILAIMAKEEKLIRMMAASPTFEAGNVYLPERAAWLHDYETELALFPNAVHDDQVDSTSQFLNWIKKPKPKPSIRVL